MTTLYMMVGMPASGKSTWRDNKRQELSAIVASSDDFIESMAQAEGKTYNEVFKDSIKPAERHMKSLITYAVTNSLPIIWDQTNLSVEVRKKRLASIPTSYRKVAVYVRCADFETWKTRLMSRPGKTIPVNVIETMRASLVPPTVEEGFDEIIEVTT